MRERQIRRLLQIALTPMPKERREWYRAAGACVCETCGFEYRLHPSDRTFFDLNVLCNGDRVKL